MYSLRMSDVDKEATYLLTIIIIKRQDCQLELDALPNHRVNKVLPPDDT